MRFRDRIDAGKQLAKALKKYKGKPVVVFALPRGGVPVAKEVARALKASLDLIIVRKLGHPWSSEYAIGAVTEKGKPLLNKVETVRIDKEWLVKKIVEERQEARRRSMVYLGDKKRVSVKGKIAIVVDDGVATGLTFRKAIEEVRSMKPKRLVAAVPVMPGKVVAEFEKLVDELLVLEAPENYLGAVGAYYDQFGQVGDEEVVRLMDG